MSVFSKTVRDSDFEQILDPLGTIVDPGYNASEKFLIFQISAIILKFVGNG